VKKLGVSLVIFVIVAVIALSSVWGQEKNLATNKAVTAKIRAFDQEFFKGFDVYAAETDEYPTALLFDRKGDAYQLPDHFWGRPLTEEEIIRSIRRLDAQHLDPSWDVPFWPQALAIVNMKGEILGYVYTGLSYVVTDRKKDGRVTVFRPIARRLEIGETLPPPPMN
jgi:hypothetical protein